MLTKALSMMNRFEHAALYPICLHNRERVERISMQNIF